MIELKFIFETIEEAYEFLNKKIETQPKPKKENDGSGKSTKEFHIKVKLYKAKHPDKTYRTCLKEQKQLNKITMEIE